MFRLCFSHLQVLQLEPIKYKNVSYFTYGKCEISHLSEYILTNAHT